MKVYIVQSEEVVVAALQQNPSLCVHYCKPYYQVCILANLTTECALPQARKHSLAAAQGLIHTNGPALAPTA